ncbi:MAG: FAD-dependent oxidoreductase, partial [Gemmatimonadota bacterium]|nr:FAD-dependent oxidoreductase [Gemmatimonadota bacterium]
MPEPTLTRRQVLRTLGLMGGSSFMMGAMGSWDLMGPPSKPRPELRGPQPDTRVLILGGGISGLTVGYELGKLDYDYRVLEARDWPGGLCWTVRRGATHTEIGGETQVCDFDEGQYLNAGAWRVPNADTSVLEYCRELGVPLEIFIDHANANYFYEESDDIGPLSGRPVRLREVRADLWGSTSELLAKAMNEGRIDLPLSEEDRGRLVEWLVRSGFLDSEDQLYRPPESRGSDSRLDLSALLQS